MNETFQANPQITFFFFWGGEGLCVFLTSTAFPGVPEVWVPLQRTYSLTKMFHAMASGRFATLSHFDGAKARLRDNLSWLKRFGHPLQSKSDLFTFLNVMTLFFMSSFQSMTTKAYRLSL